jgi:hypothetical protein
MNERIRELLKQSTNPPWDGEQGPMNEFNLEKFAELIVEECARICDVIRESNGGDKQFGARLCADEIRATLIYRRSKE